jgi:glycosyltransferase involved in cell wall biosynthesis
MILMKKPKILHYYSSSTQIGGPLTYINIILNSELNKTYEFNTCFQMMAPKGINLPLLSRMRDKIKSFAPDILHVHGLQSEGFYGLLAGRLAGCKRILVTVHGLANDTVEMDPIKKILYKFFVEPITLRNVDFVYCVCDYGSNRPIIKKNARRLLRTIHTGIMPVIPLKTRGEIRDELGLAQNKVVGIIVSRVVKDKGYYELSEVFKKLYQRGEDRVMFCLVGEGEYVEELKRKLNQEISTDYVRLCGRRHDVANLLFASDFFVLPSWHENFPISLLEAGRAGLPSIATNVGGIPEIIDHKITGLLIPSNNIVALSNAIDQFLDHPDQMSLMGKRAKEKIVTSFNLGAMTEKIHNTYVDILSYSGH